MVSLQNSVQFMPTNELIKSFIQAKIRFYTSNLLKHKNQLESSARCPSLKSQPGETRRISKITIAQNAIYYKFNKLFCPYWFELHTFYVTQQNNHIQFKSNKQVFSSYIQSTNGNGPNIFLCQFGHCSGCYFTFFQLL